MKQKLRKFCKKYIIVLFIMAVVFVGGFFVGHLTKYEPNVYKKIYTDTNGVQYIVIISKEGDVEIHPRLNKDGTLYSKKNFTFVINDN